MRVWSFLVVDEGDRQYRGNRGYEDDPSTVYRFDSLVPNHKRIKLGDIAVIRSRERVLGLGRVRRLVLTEGTKDLQRCPVCGFTGIKSRLTKTPEFRCNRGHEFDEPDVETRPCTLYEVRFRRSFRVIKGVSVAQVSDCSLTRNKQLSIEELDGDHPIVKGLIGQAEL